MSEIKTAWCPTCQRGNKYDDKGLCLDCKTEIAQPYKYEDMEGKEEQIMESAYEKGETLEVSIDTEEIKPKKKRKMSEETKAKIRATRAKNKKVLE